jgi:small-conductance mechanosensitive channel
VLILLTYIFWGGRPLTLFTGLGLIGLAFAVATQWY